jgi:hypothetical protein
MFCADYQKLKKAFGTERERWLSFAAASERKSKDLAIEALEKMNQVRSQMFTHRQLCAACNGTDTPKTLKTRSAKAGSKS